MSSSDALSLETYIWIGPGERRKKATHNQIQDTGNKARRIAPPVGGGSSSSAARHHHRNRPPPLPPPRGWWQ